MKPWPTYSLSLKLLAVFLGFKWRETDPSGARSSQWFHEWVETGYKLRAPEVRDIVDSGARL